MILIIICLVLIAFIVLFYLNKHRFISFQYPNTVGSEIKQNGILNLLSYNVAGLPEKISSAKTPRSSSMLLIGEELNRYDIVNVQEDFNYNEELYRNSTHPFKTKHRGKVMWGDGLNTLSKYAILELRRVPWLNCNGSDCLTPKGFSLARICIAQDIVLDVYNVHATSANSFSGSRARRKNLDQLADFIIANSSGKPLIVMGDFNAHYQFHLDNMQEFIKKTQLQDSWVETILQGQYPQVDNNYSIVSDLDCTNNDESIDKILYRSSHNLIFRPIDFEIVLNYFKDVKGQALSDHLAVKSTLEWQLY